MSILSVGKNPLQLPLRLRQGAAPSAQPTDAVVPGSQPAEANSGTLSALGHKVYALGEKLMVPSNFPNSVSKDYAATRKWQLTRDLAGSISFGYAASAAMAAATIPGIAAVGLGLFGYQLIKDRVGQAAGLVSSVYTPIASRNPRAWALGGDAIDNAGVALLSCAALAPQFFVPLAIGSAAVGTFAGTMRGAALADVGPRQAVADNLGELNAKNGNQGLIVNNLGLLIGGGLSYALGGILGSMALPVIGATFAAAGLYATSQMLTHLDMNPVNETAVRQVCDALDHQQEVPPPQREGVWQELNDLWKADTIQLGQDPEVLKNDPARFAQLKDLYAAKNYLLEAVAGQPLVVLKSACTAEDRFQAVYQAVEMENLRKSEEFATVLQQRGQDKADFWLVEQSLARTPKDVKPLLGKMKEAGWSTDMLRFLDTGFRPQAGEV